MHCAAVESLETRLLFATFISRPVSFPIKPILAPQVPIPTIDNGVLHLTGNKRDNIFIVSRADNVNEEDLAKGIVFVNKGTTNVVQPGSTSVPTNVPSGPYFRIQTTGSTFYVTDTGVTKMHVDTGAGDDNVVIATNVRLPSVLIGARGDDTLEGGTRDDTISGGAGDDVLIGGRANTAANRIDGGAGFDLAYVASIDDGVSNVENIISLGVGSRSAPRDNPIDAINGPFLPAPPELIPNLANAGF